MRNIAYGNPPRYDKYYNTKLSSEQEAAYNRWLESLPLELRNDYDYDLRGAWLAGVNPDERGHMPDTYKKPWHPTFSDESRFSSPAARGGHWYGDTFVPGPVNKYAGSFKYGNYGQGVFADGGGIHIKKENRGKFTEAANRAGMGVQAYARHILANKDNYSSTLVKRANFARNASSWHGYGGVIGGQYVKYYDNGGPIKWIKEFGRKIVDKEARNAPVYKEGTFGEAYANAKMNGSKTFYYKGDYYNTNESVNEKAEVFEGPSFSDAYRNARYYGVPEFNYGNRTYAAPAITVSELYKEVSGNDWENAKKYGFADGTKESNERFLSFLKERKPYQWGSKPTIRRIPDQTLTNDEIAVYYALYLNRLYQDKVMQNNGMYINPENGFITLTNAGKNTGTKVSVDVLDRIMDYAESNNLPLEVAFGLPAQESAFGAGYNNNSYDFYNKIDKKTGKPLIDLGSFYSAWDYNNSSALGYVKTARKNGNWEAGFKPMMRKWSEEYANANQDILDWAYNYFLSGNYNKGDKSHTQDVLTRGRDFLNSPEIQEYLKERKSKQLKK